MNIPHYYSTLLGQVSFDYEKPIKIITKEKTEILISPNVIIKLSPYFNMCYKYNEIVILDYDYSLVQKMLKILHNTNIHDIEISEHEFRELMNISDFINCCYLGIFLFNRYLLFDTKDKNQQIDDLLYFAKYFSTFEIDLRFHEELLDKFLDLTDSHIDYLIKLAIIDSKFAKYLKFSNNKQYFDIIEFYKYKEQASISPGYRLFWNYLSTYSGMNNIYVYEINYLDTKTKQIENIFKRVDKNTFEILLNTLEYYETYFSNIIYNYIYQYNYNKNLLGYLKKPSDDFKNIFYIPSKFAGFFSNEMEVKPLLFSLEELKKIYEKIHE
ncbi:hypothetical protein Hokovirus_1_21 [Hokovirus HKV1]|uniref:Uncharacterized protein n=1 Tax=Hokovirus HKV1 TaxID=1977638 RepID=A0A1V0SEK4_9VIRU|nr:hypothetical protein Hokovirus_1_21 [Hokovirus HKV1]